MTEPEVVWWSRVPIAVSFIEQCISDAKEFKPSYVDSKTLPWADRFLDMTEKAIRDKSQSFKVYTVNGVDFNPEHHYDLLDLMVQRIGGFRNYDSTIESIGPELNRSMIFFLVKAVSGEQLNRLKNIAWEAEQYQINLRMIVQTDLSKEDDEAIKEFKYYSSDINFFILNLLLEKKSVDLLNYKAGLATLLSVRDAEKAAMCCKEIDNCMYSPAQVCTWLTEQQVADLEYKAQLKYVMPELETARLNFSRLVRGKLRNNALPHREMINGTLYIYNEADELEYRHLVYFYKKISPLITLSVDEWEKLEVLYDARNDLAHLRRLDVNRLREVKNVCDSLER